MFVKQIYTATFWEVDEDDPATEDSPDRRVRVEVRRQRRGVNVFRVDRTTRTAEIRIDRIRSREDRTLAAEELETFGTSLARVLNFERHLVPVPIRRAFPRIIDAEDETFIATDLAADADVRQMFSSRREGRRGQDVRKHGDYKLRGPNYVRDSVNVYWDYRPEPYFEPESIHTIIRAVEQKREADANDDAGDENGDPVDDVVERQMNRAVRRRTATIEYAKVYIPAHISEAALRHVIGRIRHFAR